MNEALQALEIKVENGGATPQGKFFAKDWNTLVEAVKQLDLAEFDEEALNKYLKDNGYITSDDIPSTDLSNLVTLSTEQTIPGPKNFTGGIKVNGQPLIYNAELGVWELTGDLLVTGNVAWFASIKGFKPSTIMDAIQVDGESIVINERGQLKAIGGGSGGSGGGLTVSDLSNYLTTNKYTKQSDVETLIAIALTPYALTAAIPTNNNQLTNGAGYITAAALDGYATQSWVEGKKYLTGITSSQVTTALGFTPYDSANPDKYIKGIDYDMIIAALGYTPYSTTNPMGYLTISSLLGYATEQWVGDNYQPIINSSNKLAYSLISGTPTKLSQFTDDIVAANYLSKKGGIIQTAGIADFAIYRTNGVYSVIHFYNTQDGNMTDVGYLGAASDGKPVYINSGGSVFDLIHSNNIGLFNAGSATKLATSRTIWGQSFDGTADVSGTIKNVDVIRNARSNWIIGEASLDGEVHIGSASFAQARTLYNANGMLSLLANGTFRLLRREDTPPLMHSILTYEAAPYGLLTRINTDGSVSLQAQREANDAECFRLLLNPLGGNVVIGGTSADAKLHVHGDAKVDGTIIVNPSVASDVSITFRSGTASDGLYDYKVGKFTDVNGKSAFGIGMAKADGSYEKFLGISVGGVYDVTSVDIMTNTTINGNLLVNGNVSWITQSQRSLKHITSEQGLSLAQLERIKPIKFYWKDRRDTVLHVGGIADDMQEVLPEVVQRGWDNTLRMNYVDASFYIGASLIAPVLDHDRRIAQLEKENAELKQKLNQLTA